MILFNDSEVNIILNLYNEIGLTYSLTLENEMNRTIIDNIILEDQSAFPQRYNSFILERTTRELEDKNNGKIYIPFEGFYYYKFYLNNVIVGEGIMKVVGQPEINVYTYTENDNNTTFSYEKNKNRR